MTTPETHPGSTGDTRKIEVCSTTITVLPPSEELLVSLGLRQRRIERVTDDHEAYEQLVGLLNDAMMAVVPAWSDQDKLISMIASKKISVQELLSKILGYDGEESKPDNREQRRASARRRSGSGRGGHR